MGAGARSSPAWGQHLTWLKTLGVIATQICPLAQHPTWPHKHQCQLPLCSLVGLYPIKVTINYGSY